MTVMTGLVGHPVSHSRSPLIHEYWLKEHQIRGCYNLVDLPCETLQHGLEKLRSDDYRGFNVTVPHKVSVMRLCDHVDDLAQSIGAVNTVTISGGQLYGTNTDSFGFVQNIKELIPTFDFSIGPALVLGAGGAARAVVQGLLEQDVPEIILCNRTLSKATEFLKLFNNTNELRIIDWQLRADYQVLSRINLLINTTSLGMTGKSSLDMDITHLHRDALVNDIVYAPLMTPLLQKAQMQGNRIVTGIGMLLHQARPAFQKWHGILPEVTTELRNLVSK